MFPYSRKGVTMYCILAKRERSDGLSQVAIRVTYERKTAYFRTGLLISQGDWDSIAKTKRKDLVKIREDLLKDVERMKGIIDSMTEENNFSIAALKRLMKHGDEKEEDIMYVSSYFDKHIRECEEDERLNTRDFYLYAKKSVEDVFPNLSMKELTPNLLSQLETTWRKKGLNPTTIAMKMRSLRTIVNLAMKEGVISRDNYPFGHGKYEIRSTKGVKRALSKEQLKQIFEYYTPLKRKNMYKNIWLFQYMCNGINVADLVNLKFGNIQNGEIVFVRKKTKNTTGEIKEIHVPLTKEMKAIISEFGNLPDRDSRIFPLIEGKLSPDRLRAKTSQVTKMINKTMNKIGKELGIGHITTYTARHSFATVMKRSGVSTAFIAESLGHSSVQTTESYLASFEEDERKKNAKVLVDFL